MAELPKIDSEGLRLAKREGAARVSSVVRVSKHNCWKCGKAASLKCIEQVGYLCRDCSPA